MSSLWHDFTHMHIYSVTTTSFGFHLQVQKARYDLPSHDALAQILPNYQHLYKGAETELHNTDKQQQQEEEEQLAERLEPKLAHKSNINHTYQVHHPHKRWDWQLCHLH